MKPTIPFFLITLALGCFALSPKMQAVVPPPDGGYPGGNTAEGQAALLSLTTGGYNTAVGYLSLLSNATNSFNTGIGAGALALNTADENTATGAGALFSNTTGFFNTADGAFALFSNTTGQNNTATGFEALFSNTTGSNNTAVGRSTLGNNTTGSPNTAIGAQALAGNTTGAFNTAIGSSALSTNTTSNNNTATGSFTLFEATGASNTATGFLALRFTTSGSSNTASGVSALQNNTTASNNTALGFQAGENQTTGSNNVYIGAGSIGVAGESNACYIASIFGQTSGGGAPVLINAAGKLGTTTSSRRFKDDIKPMDKASETLFTLKPVCFRYKKEIDPQRVPQFGLVAEEVEKVNPDLVVRDKEGKANSVRYDQVNAMLLNEFLKEHHKNEQQRKDFEAAIAQQQKQIEALTTGLQKMSTEMEASKHAPQVVNNP